MLVQAGRCRRRTTPAADHRDGRAPRLKGEKFEYPADYQPSQLSEGMFGLIGGPRTRVRIFFDEKVARYVRRRQWHPTQELKKVEGGIELTVEVAGTVELQSWVLGFGDKAEVLEPESLRDEVAAELGRAAARYARGLTPGDGPHARPR